MNNLQLRGQLYNRSKTTNKIFYTRFLMIQTILFPVPYCTAQSAYHTRLALLTRRQAMYTMDNCCTDHYKAYLLRHVLPCVALKA